VAADPYEIPARWVEDEDGEEVLSPIGVDFSFTHIEHVPELGIVAYGDRLMLRVDDEERPHVTLGIAKRRFSDDSRSYTSIVPLTDGTRLLSVGHVTSEKARFLREARIERADVVERKREAFPFPSPSEPGATWWSIGLFAGHDLKVLALAARSPPIDAPMLETPPATALEQRVYELRGSEWAPLSDLAPTIFTVSDACLAGSSLFAVGTKIERAPDGTVTARRGGAAELADHSWNLGALPAPSAGIAVFGLDRVACGPARDFVVAVGASAATTASAGRRALYGPSLMYAFDGKNWKEIDDHPGAPTPERPDYVHVSAVAIAPNRTLWVAYERPDDPTRSLFRYSAGSWQAYPLPHVPTVAHYVIRGIAFDPDGRGWAISNLEGAADHPESRGILLRFNGEKWEQQPWTWSPLDQRWWGLFGKLS
jgi:hypothetical protein